MELPIVVLPTVMWEQWDPYKIKHITDIEDVQRNHTSDFSAILTFESCKLGN